MNNVIYYDYEGLKFSLGILSFSFVCHDTAFLYYNTLHNGSITRWNKLVFTSIFLSIFITLLLSIPGYLLFLNETDGNVLNNFDVHSTIIIITRIIYVLVMTFSYPMCFFVVRHVLYDIFQKLVWKFNLNIFKKPTIQRNIMNNNSSLINIAKIEFYMDEFSDSNINTTNETKFYTIKDSPLSHHIFFTCLVFYSSLFIAIYVTNLGQAMSIVGSLTCINLGFVYPCWFWIKASKVSYKFWNNNNKFYTFLDFYPPFIVAILGIILAIYSVYSTIVF